MRTYILIMTLLSLITLPAVAKDRAVEKLEERLALTEQSLTDLQESIRNQGMDTATHLAIIDQIRADWNGYQGVVDAISQQQQLMIDQLQKYMDEFEGRINSIETAMAEAGVAKPEQNTGTVDSAADAMTYYHEGLRAVRDRDYVTAKASFEQFTRRSRDKALVANAKFWIAECLYASGNYQAAIKAYGKFTKSYPEHEKITEAELKQGQAFAKLDMLDDAKAKYLDIIDKYPNQAIASRAQTRLNLMNQASDSTEDNAHSGN